MIKLLVCYKNCTTERIDISASEPLSNLRYRFLDTDGDPSAFVEIISVSY